MMLQDIVCGSPAMKVQEMLNGWYIRRVGRLYVRPNPSKTKQKIGGALTYAKNGLYRNCWKVDVPSLYPCIMERYEIYPGPEKDPDRAFLCLLSCIKEERLRLKELGRTDPDAKMRSEALKILINSFYGLLGSGQPHNNPDAAELVTAYGRKILVLMMETMENMGCEIAEADTDGIIASGAEPAAVIAAVNKALPEGISVGLEWTMPWVYIHAPKNYILYDGTKHICKGLFHKRDQPGLLNEFVFGFLDSALKNETECISYYNGMVDRIKTGRLPAETVTVKRKRSASMVNFGGLGNVGDKISYYVGTSPGGKEINVASGPYDVWHYVRYVDKLMAVLMKNVFKKDFATGKYPTRRMRKCADADLQTQT